jgi:hypothetical protein
LNKFCVFTIQAHELQNKKIKGTDEGRQRPRKGSSKITSSGLGYHIINPSWSKVTSNGGVKIMIQDILEKIIIARVYLKDRPEFTLGAKANKKTYEMLLIIFSSKVQDYEKRGNMYGERCSRNDHHSGIVYLKERPEFMLSAKTNKNFANCC